MRRRRQLLQVQTFPFLAVLLCTMGSLILLLLVIDRRAKAVARARALQARSRAEDAHARELAQVAAEQQRDYEKKRAELHNLLARQECAIGGELRAAEAQVSKAASQVRAEQHLQDELRQRLRNEQALLEADRRLLEGRRQEVQRATLMQESARRQATALAADLVQLEDGLAALKARQRQRAQTYSVVPYFGQQGDSRRPVYVECAAGAVIFHPERQVIRAPAPMELRRELEKRMATVSAGETVPYLLLLVRPDGVATYKKMEIALAGLRVDYGYELIDQDWALDLSAAPPAGSGSAAAVLPDREVDTPRSRTGAGRGSPGPAHSGPPSLHLAGPGDAAAFDASGPPTTGGPSRFGSPLAGSASAIDTAPGSPHLPGGGPGVAIGLPGQGPAPTGPASGPVSQRDPDPQGGRPDSAMNQGALAGPLVRRASGGMGASRPPSPLGRLLGSRDWLIPIACKGEGVELPSTGQTFPLASLRPTSTGPDSLLSSLRQLIDRRQATVRPDEPAYRPVLRYRVYPDGLRAYYAANALLAPLGLPARRENLDGPSGPDHRIP